MPFQDLLTVRILFDVKSNRAMDSLLSEAIHQTKLNPTDA